MYKVLVVEDSKTIAKALAMKLIKHGFEPHMFYSYEDVKLELTDENQYFAAILDLTLPDATNGEVVDLVLKYKIPSIVLTAVLDDEIYEFMTNKNIIDYVIKNREEDLDYTVSIVDKISKYIGKKVLIVDDSALSRTVLKNHLKLLLFDVYSAKDGKDALEFLENNRDVIMVVTDYHMPIMDGFELTLNIRKKYSKEELVIIAVTSHGSYEVTAKFLKYGANGYINKPFTKEEFNYTINNSLEIVQALKDNKKYLNMLSQNVVYSTTDKDGYITFVSQAFEDVTGYSKDELIGKRHSVLKHPEMNEYIYKELWETIRNGKKWVGELRNLKKDGTDYWINVEIEPLFDNYKNIIGYVAIRFDITDKIIKEKQQNIMFQQARQATIGEILNTIAHQWRQPLTAIAMILQNIQDDIEYNEQELDITKLETTFEKAYSQLDYLSKTIDNFRFFFKPSNEKIHFNIKNMFVEIYTLLERLFLEYDIEFKMDMSDIFILNYENEFKQVAINLITNSMEAILKIKEQNSSFKGLILIEAFVDTTYVSINFIDNGIGIDENIKNKIFEPYFSTKHDKNGKGMSLFICKNILELNLHGSLELLNCKNNTKFNLKIPLKS
ncbi:MAG: response regulator [Campylobacterales bacterium]|nr:response regulator [Campylobacterales bacterium]